MKTTEDLVQANHSTSNVSAIIENRHSKYGTYYNGTMLRVKMMEDIELFHFQTTGKKMDTIYYMMILDIVNKITRLAATPNHLDSVIDIEGYARLYKETLQKELCTAEDTKNEISF